MSTTLIVIFLFAVSLVGCKNEPRAQAPVDNSATRYGAGLAAAPQKAQDAAEKANQAIAAQQALMEQAARELE